METWGQMGAMYAQLNETDVIERRPIELGDGILRPGEWVRQLGEKKRSKFSMQNGYYLRYEGWIEKHLLFGVNHSTNEQDIYYAFAYIDSNLLYVQTSSNGGYDIQIHHLEKLTGIPDAKEDEEQLSLF